LDITQGAYWKRYSSYFSVATENLALRLNLITDTFGLDFGGSRDGFADNTRNHLSCILILIVLATIEQQATRFSVTNQWLLLHMILPWVHFGCICRAKNIWH